MNIKPKYHILKTSVVLISLLICTQNSQGRYTCIICHGKLQKDHCLVLQKQFWSRCSLEQSFTGNKIAKATIKVFLICNIIALGLEEQIKINKKKIPVIISFKHICIHIHTHLFVFWIKIKNPAHHCNVIYLQCENATWAKILHFTKWNFYTEFSGLPVFGPLLPWLQHFLVFTWRGANAQSKASSYILVSLNLENGQL